MDVREFSRFVSFIIPAVLIFGTITGFYNYKKIDAMHKSIAIYLLLMLLMEVASRVLGMYGNNFIILPVISLLELSFFIYFYSSYLLRRKKVFTWVGILGVVYIVGETIFYFVLNDVSAKQFQPYSKVVDNFIIIVMALAFFLEKIDGYKETNWNNFRLNTMLLIFFTINTLVFLPFNFLVNETTGLKFYFWSINIIILIILDIYLAYSIWKNARKPKSPNYKKVVR